MAAWNSYVCGAAVVLLAVIALIAPAAAWQEWANFAIGVWLAVASWLLPAATYDSQAVANQMVVGTILAVSALWAAARRRRVVGSY